MRGAVERVVYHAALLAGEGARARETAHFAAEAALGGDGRSCLDAGAPVQIFVDVPAASGLRFAVRLDDAALARGANLAPGLVGDEDARVLATAVQTLALPAPRRTFGLWLLQDALPTLAADVRGLARAAAVAVLRPLLTREGRARLDAIASALDGATPWGVLLGARDGHLASVELRWSLDRGVSPARVARALGDEDAWSRAAPVLARVLGEEPTERTRPWQVTTRLDVPLAPAFATSAWSRRPDGEAKRERLLAAVDALGGERGRLDAMWRLLRQGVPEQARWIVGRGLEVRAAETGPLLRVVLVPALTLPTEAPSPAG